MTATSLWSQATETVSSTGAGNPGTIGLHVTVSAAATLGGLWLYSPSGHSLTQLPTTIGLFNFSTHALIHSEAATWSGAAGSGWVFAAFSSPPPLASGTGYMVAAFRNDAVNGWFCFDEPFTWPVTASPVTAPKDTGNGQGWFTNTTTGITFPTSQDAGFNWWLDVSVSVGASHTTAPALTVSPSFSAARTHAGRGPAALTVTPSFGVALNGRSQYTWPFTWDSIWNLPVSADAEYAPTGITVTSDFSTDPSAVEYCCTDPAQPVKVLQNALLPGGSTGHANVYTAAGMSAPGTFNDCGAFLGTDNDTVYQGQTLSLTAGGNPSWGGVADVPSAPVSITGDGITGSHGGSGLSALGGTLTTADLTGSGPIRHAMKLCFNGFLYYSHTGAGFQWPAVTADDGFATPADPNFYGGSNPAIVLGALLALPPFISPAKYSDPLVQKIAVAMQAYGAYLVDNTASGAGVSDSLIELNYDAAVHFTGSGTFSGDFHQLLEDLQVITNSAEATPGGGAIGSDRFAEYAPAFSDGTGAPDAVTVVAPSSVLMESLQDAFPGTTLNAQWGSYGTVAVTGGHVAIDAITDESGVFSNAGFMLTGSFMLAKVTPYTGGTGPYAYFQAAAETGSGGAGIQYNAGSLFAYTIDDTGAVTNLTPVTYNATTHAWWRIRESAGTTFFDTSPDGAAWTNRWSAGNPITYNSMLAQCGSGTGGGTAGNTLLADFNVPSSVPHAGSASLTVTPVLAARAVFLARAALTVTPVLAATASTRSSASLTVAPVLGATLAAGTAAVLTVTPVLAARPETGTTAALTVTPVLAARPARGQPSTAALTVTLVPGASGAAAAAAALTVNPVLSAVAARGAHAAAALTVTPSLAAGGATTTAAALTVTPVPGAAAAASAAGTAFTALTVTPLLTTAAGTSSRAALTVAPVLTALAAGSTPHAGTAALEVTPVTGTGAEAGTVGPLTVIVAMAVAASPGAGAALTVAPVFAAAALREVPAAAALSVDPVMGASPSAGTGAALTVPLSLGASAGGAAAATASLAVVPVLGAAARVSVAAALTVALTAGAAAGRGTVAALTVTVAFTAAAEGQTAGDGQGALTVAVTMTAVTGVGRPLALVVRPVMSVTWSGGGGAPAKGLLMAAGII